MHDHFCIKAVAGRLREQSHALNCFTKKPFWGVTELSTELDMNKSNVYTILKTLESMGYIEQASDSLKYRLGYAIDNMEHEYGIKCVAAPIFNQKYDLVGAISVSGPSLRFNEENIRSIQAHLQACCSAIRERI